MRALRPLVLACQELTDQEAKSRLALVERSRIIHPPFSNVFRTIATLLNKPITIYGNGKQVRDTLNVQDFVYAVDAFFMLGGFFTGFVLTKKFKKTTKILKFSMTWLMAILGRALRIL